MVLCGIIRHYLGVAQSGSVLGMEPRSQWFKSTLPDNIYEGEEKCIDGTLSLLPLIALLAYWMCTSLRTMRGGFDSYTVLLGEPLRYPSPNIVTTMAERK